MGDNATLVTTLAKDRGTVKILGLVISNALVALGGCIVCHETRSFSATMGTGQLVYGLAAVIIGVSLMNFYSSSRLAGDCGGRASSASWPRPRAPRRWCWAACSTSCASRSP